MTEVMPFGDHAVRFAVPSSIALRRALFLRMRALPGVLDVVLCEEVGCVVLGDATPEDVTRALAEPLAAVHAPPARHVVRVVYDGEDLPALAATLGLRREAILSLHCDRAYEVSMLGFLPGFAYLRGLAPELVLPRRAPRPRVPARSVAIGAEYAGIYPVASAGGWHLLGRALDAPRFALGDEVTFVASASASASALDDVPAPAVGPPPPAGPHLVITRLAGLALFVDGSRRGRMHEGMPPGGPLVRRLLARANANAGNGPDACAIELTGMLEVEACGGTVHVADDSHAATLREGERFTLTSGKLRARYLTIGGGIDAPIIDGGRGALLPAGISRPLRRADTVASIDPASVPPRAAPPSDRDGALALAIDLDTPIAILPGPDATPEALDRLHADDLAISTVSDRTGTRLAGAAPALPAGTRPSAPMIEGAIELTPSGFVVLGPDHPTTGGYPVVALLRAHARDAFFAKPLGAKVRFNLDRAE